MKKNILLLLSMFMLSGCTVSYKFNGASIDYSLTKTIDIRDFINQAPLVYNPLAQVFNEELRDMFMRNTKLQFTKVNPDLELEGEIIRYDLTPLSVRENALASETRLTIAVRVRFRNNKNPLEDKDETITSFLDFPSSEMLTNVQDQLIEKISRDIVDQIFNLTMSNW